MTSGEDQIEWVALMLDLTPEQEAMLETRAQAAGLSLKCYCVHLLHKHLLEDVSAVQKERWQQEFPATLRRNGCDESFSLPGLVNKRD